MTPKAWHEAAARVLEREQRREPSSRVVHFVWESNKDASPDQVALLKSAITANPGLTRLTTDGIKWVLRELNAPLPTCDYCEDNDSPVDGFHLVYTDEYDVLGTWRVPCPRA